MVRLSFEIQWDKQLSRNLRVAVTNLKNLKPFHQEAIDIMEKKSLKIFAKKWKNVQKSPKWKPLADSTKKAREKRWWYYKKAPKKPSTLVWTWKMKSKRRKVANNNFWTFEFTDRVAQFHQKWWRNLPKRALIDLDNKTNANLVRALQRKINKDIKIFWFQQ